MTDDDRTPLEVLDDAVQAFVNAQTEYAGTLLTGWTLGYQVSGADGSESWWDTSYATGPSTNPATGVGIARMAEVKMLQDLVGPDDDVD